MHIDCRSRRAGPVWDGRDDVSECGIINFVNEDPEEGVGLIVGIGLKLGVHLGDKRGGYGREQTGLKS